MIETSIDEQIVKYIRGMLSEALSSASDASLHEIPVIGADLGLAAKEMVQIVSSDNDGNNDKQAISSDAAKRVEAMTILLDIYAVAHDSDPDAPLSDWDETDEIRNRLTALTQLIEPLFTGDRDTCPIYDAFPNRVRTIDYVSAGHFLFSEGKTLAGMAQKRITITSSVN